MAKTTREKPQKKPKITGPVLVEEVETPPEAVSEAVPPEDLEDQDDEAEEDEQQAEAVSSSDPRRVPASYRMEPTEFSSFVAQYPDPNVLDAYFYRLTPIVKAIPPPDWPPNKKFPTYCEKLKGLITPQTNQVFTWEWLANVRGSGKYNIKLVDRSLKRTQHREITQTTVEINEWDSRPPVLNDWRELVPCDANKWIIDRLLREKVIKRTPEGGFVAYEEGKNGTAPNPTDPTEILKQTVTLAKDLAQTMTPKEKPEPKPLFSGDNIVAMLKETQAANDPQKIISAAKELVQIAKPAEVKPDNTLVTVLTAFLNKSSETAEADRERAFKSEQAARAREHELQMKLMEKNNAPAPAAPVSPIAALASQTEELKKLQEIFGPKDDGAAAAKVSHMNATQEFWQPIATKALEVIQPVFNVGAQVLGQMVTMKMAQEAVKQQGAQQPRPAPPSQPNAIPQQQMMPAQQPQPQPLPAQNAPQAPQEPQQQYQPTQEEIMQAQANAQMQLRLQLLGTAITQVDGTLRKYFRDGRTGGDFADWFCALSLPAPPPLNMVQEEISGVQALNAAKEICSNPAYVEFCKGNPIIQFYREPQNAAVWGTMCPTPERAKEFDEFIAAFLAYDPEALEPEVIP